MLSRRRRHASTSSLKYNGAKRFNVAKDERDVVVTRREEEEEEEIRDGEMFEASKLVTSTTETSTLRYENRWFALSNGRVVDHDRSGDDENDENDEDDDETSEKRSDRSTRDVKNARNGSEIWAERSMRVAKTEKWTNRRVRSAEGTVKRTDRSTRDENSITDASQRNASSTMSSTGSRRLTQRNAVVTSRHRRRKSPLLDSNDNDYVFQNSFTSTTNQRIANISWAGGVNVATSCTINNGELGYDDSPSTISSRINDRRDVNTSDVTINKKIPDNDKSLSRGRCDELYESKSRLNYHRRWDVMKDDADEDEDDDDDEFLTEHKSSRRQKHDGIPSCASAIRCKRNVTSRSTRAKLPWYVIVAIFTLATLMTTEVTARQNHHRTCPGCPHQHVHTINRKSGTGYEEEQLVGSRDPETSPSPDDLRLEAIKHQILTKLGLRTRPDVNRTLASVPRHLALETLYRAEAQPSGPSIENDDYHEGRRRDHHHRRLDNGDLDYSSPSSSSSSSLSSSSSSSSSSKLSSSKLSPSSSSSSSSSPSASSSYGQFYYDGEEYSYRNVDQGALDEDDATRISQDGVDEPTLRATYVNKDRHRGRHGDLDGERTRDYHHRGDANDDDDETQIEMDDFYARTSEIISFAEPGRTLNGQPLLEFPRSSGDPALEPLRIKRATLWARVELRHANHYQHHRRSQNNQRNITLWVFRVRCGNVTHLRGKELGEHLEMVTSLGVKVNQLGWQKFDVTRVVSSWYSGHETPSTRNEKLTLLVDCTGCGSHVHVSTFGVQAPHVVDPTVNAKAGQDPDRPFLVVRTDPAAVKRVRRRAIECSGAIKGQCCKQRFYVSFSQLGWDDWIIAPQGYYANYCRGDCAAGHRTPDTFLNYYTHVIEEYRKMDRLAGMQPCCAPLKFSPMSLIYYGPDSNIIKRDLPKMVVDECGCP